MAGPLRDARGAGLVEAIAAVAVLALLVLTLFQLQAVAVAVNRQAVEHFDVHHALRQFLVWVEGDAAVACKAWTEDGGRRAVLQAVFGGEERRVRYLPEGQALVRVVLAVAGGTETEVRRWEVGRPLTVTWHGYDPSTGLLAFTVASRSLHGRAELRHEGAVWLRGSAAGGC